MLPSRVLLLLLLLADAHPALGFALMPFADTDPAKALPAAARWLAGSGLEDGIQVGVPTGFETTLGATNAAEVELVRDRIRAGFAAWENTALRFDITFDAPIQRGPSVGLEMDLIIAPAADPVFNGLILFGTVRNRHTFGSRTLSHGLVADGWTITGSDLLFNLELMIAMSALLQDDTQRLDAFQRLLMHEIGHALGFDHPVVGRHFDTDDDPFNTLVVDPADPFRDLILSAQAPTQSIMSNFVCGTAFSICPAIFFTALHPDDLAGRDVLYPAPEPRAIVLLLLGALAWRRAGRAQPSRESIMRSTSAAPAHEPSGSSR